MKYLVQFILFISFSLSSLYAGPTLKSADIVVICRNTDMDDQFALIALADIPGSSVIFLTDEGWDDNDFTFDGSEDVFRWEVHPDGISIGTIIRFSNITTEELRIDNPAHGTLMHPEGTFDMNVSSGDQLFIYQTEDDWFNGTIQRLNAEGVAEPGMIYAFNGDNTAPNTHGWLDSPNSHNGYSTQVPDNMTVVTEQGGLGNAFGLLTQLDTYYFDGLGSGWGYDTGEYDNYRYKGNVDAGDKNSWLERLHTTTNWEATDADSLPVYDGLLLVNVLPVNSEMPVELTSFSATTAEGKVNLTWETATELNNYGFEVERQESESGSQNSEWMSIGFVDGNGNSNSPKQYSFIDEDVNGKVKYRLKQIDNDGSVEYSNEIEVETIAPAVFALEQNYPNPFNPSTTIKYSIPVGNEHFRSVLKVHDILGNEIATLVEENKPAGSYEVNFDASGLSSGIYFYSLTSGAYTATSKMILMK